MINNFNDFSQIFNIFVVRGFGRWKLTKSGAGGGGMGILTIFGFWRGEGV
jgi:hypothetical protein